MSNRNALWSTFSNVVNIDALWEIYTDLNFVIFDSDSTTNGKPTIS